MMKKNKHNKIKNTGIMFESLAKQITKDILEKKENSPAINIIKNAFGKNTELKKELNLFQAILSKKFVNEQKANDFLSAIVSLRKKINNLSLKKEKYNIIKEIKNNYDINSFFSWRIPEYTIYASINKLFEDEINEINEVDESLDSKYNILEFLLKTPKIQKIKTEQELNIFSNQSTNIKTLVQQILIEQFNTKYGKLLSKPQQSIVREFINNMSNNKLLKEYMGKKIDEINVQLLGFSKTIPDKIISIKIVEIYNQLNKIKTSTIIKDNHMTAVLKTLELIHELNIAIKKNKCK